MPPTRPQIRFCRFDLGGRWRYFSRVWVERDGVHVSFPAPGPTRAGSGCVWVGYDGVFLEGGDLEEIDSFGFVAQLLRAMRWDGSRKGTKVPNDGRAGGTRIRAKPNVGMVANVWEGGRGVRGGRSVDGWEVLFSVAWQQQKQQQQSQSCELQEPRGVDDDQDGDKQGPEGRVRNRSFIYQNPNVLFVRSFARCWAAMRGGKAGRQAGRRPGKGSE